MKRMTRVAVLAGMLTAMCPVVFGIEIPITYATHEKQPGETQAWGRSYETPTLEPPAGDWKLPDLQGKDPLYVLKELGDSKHLMILDRAKPDDDFYSRLHFDANGNGDLTDDPVRTAQSQGDEYFARVRFETMDATIQVDGKSLPFSCTVDMYSFNRQQMDRAGLSDSTMEQFIRWGVYASCMYKGQLEANGKTYRIMLGDSNCSGRFNDPVSVDPSKSERLLRPEGDHLYLVPAGDKFEYRTRFVLGDQLLLDGTLYNVEINTAEERLTLTPSEATRISLKLAMETDFLTLRTKESGHALMMYRPGLSADIPAGEYGVLDYLAHRKDSKGSNWMLSAVASVDTPFVNVGEGGAELPFGEPFVPWVEVPKWSRQNFANGMNEVQLSLNLEGTAQEFVNDLERVSGSVSEIPLSPQEKNLPKEPLYKVAKPSGEVVAQGQFDYG